QARVAGVVGLLDDHLDVAAVGHLVSERAHAGVDVGHAQRGGTHVHAAPAGAEVQGHADERDLLHVAGRVLFIVPAGNSVKVDAMGAPPPTRKTAPVSVASPAEPSVDVLPILVTRKVLTTDPAERG